MRFSRDLTTPGPAWFDSWRVAAASATGASHLARSAENQDSFQTNLAALRDPIRRATTRNDPLVICVADGLGSNRHSAAGSALATALGQVHAEAVFGGQDWDRLTHGQVVRMLRHTHKRVRETWLAAVAAGPAPARARRRSVLGDRRARRRPESAGSGSSFNTTLILVVLRPPWLAIAQVGDGFVVAQDGDGRCGLLAAPRPRHEYVNTVTTLGQREPAALQVYHDLPAIRGVAVSTDGLEDSLLGRPGFDRREAKAEFFGPLFAEVASGERDSERTLRLLRSPALRAETDDDLTLVVAARSEMPAR